MNCRSGQHYTVTRGNTARWWEEPNDYGPIVSLDCAFCDFKVLTRHTRKPRTSKSGLGRYNRMRAAMVKHLHQEHRDELG